MSDISVNSGNIETKVSELTDKIQMEIIDAAKKSETTIISAVENSSGDFVDSLKEEVSRETAVMCSVGELLVKMADFIQAAAAEFAKVDTTYNKSKVQ